MNKYLTSEYVGVGHPDKIADQISDTLVDLHLEKDTNARVAIETLVSGNKVILAGEVKSNLNLSDDEIKSNVIKTVKNIGYNSNIPCDFREDNLDIHIYIKPQSQNINEGVDKEDGQIGAGDQGIMFGYATNETEHFLPLPYVISGELLKRLNGLIKEGKLPNIYTDNKSQVCCFYNNGKINIHKIILSTFHNKNIPVEEVRLLIKDEIISPILKKYNQFVSNENEIELLINSAGPFWIGGPEADAGVTGRKIIVDTYGGFSPHGGGAFSGKDPSKVDRSATYMARHIAKSIVYNGYANEALVQLSYAIGHTKPFSINVKSDSSMKEQELIKLINLMFDLSPKGIIDYLKLTDRNTIEYKNIASGGHFLMVNAPWEKIKKF